MSKWKSKIIKCYSKYDKKIECYSILVSTYNKPNFFNYYSWHPFQLDDNFLSDIINISMDNYYAYNAKYRKHVSDTESVMWYDCYCFDSKSDAIKFKNDIIDPLVLALMLTDN